MAPDPEISHNWLSMEPLPSLASDSHNYYSLGWLQLQQQNMQQEQEQLPPKLEDFFTDSNEESSSSLTHMYQNIAYEEQSLNGFRASFSANSGSEVDNNNNNNSPVESGGTGFVNAVNVNVNVNALSLAVNEDNNVVINDCKSVVRCKKKITDTFGQRTSIYRGVTRHRWTGRYEAHLWDNSCRREGQARKGRQVYLGGYEKEEKAARSYDLAALKYWGPSATTNFPITTYCKEIEEMKNATKQEFIASLRRKSSGFSRGASIYRGVTRHHQQGRWQARIGRVAGNKDLYLGTFATEEEAAEAYDIAAIKFRGLNAVTNFEMNRYDVEAIAKSSLPIGGPAKRLKISSESEEKLQLASPVENNNTISFGSTIQYGVESYDTSAPFYYQNLFHQGNETMSLMPSPTEFIVWPSHDDNQSNY